MFLNLNNYFRGLGLLLLVVCWCNLNTRCVLGAQNNFNTDTARKILKLSKAAEIKAFMNLNANPCHDFYDFACGNWKIINRAQLDNINTDKFVTLSSGIENKLQSLLLTNKTGNSAVEDKIKDFHNSCLMTKTDVSKYRAELANIYKEYGEFSALKEKAEGQQNQTNFKWWSTVANIQYKYGKSIILSLYILDDIKDKTKTMAYIGPPEFDMTQGAATNLVHVIEEQRIRKFLQFYLNVEEVKAKEMAQDIMAFETTLTWGATDVRHGSSIEELLTLYNTTDLYEKYKDLFDFREYLELVLGTNQLPDQVYVYDESYLEALHEVFNSTDTKLVEDYVLWLFLEEFIVYINQKDLQSKCIYQTKKYFGKFIDHVIYNKFRTAESEAEIYELWEDIKYTFEHNLQGDKYYWISNDTREEAIKKLRNMNLTINSYDNDNFVELFKNLDIDPTNYVQNVKNILEHAASLHENKLEKKTEEDAQLLSFTPVYNILENRIKIPVALLQPYFIWNPVYPKAIQYGTLGYFLAHEMIHGFDDEGRKYDANGNAQIWWDEKSAYEFESRRKCFQEQYHKYKYGDKFLPKSALQSENIADNGGLNIAYDAYRLWLNKHKANGTEVEATEALPRLNFNNRQLFFISFAQIWCEDIHSLFQSTFADGDIHAPGMYRVIGSLSNSREFSWLFKCNEKESRMDPPKKCEIY